MAIRERGHQGWQEAGFFMPVLTQRIQIQRLSAPNCWWLSTRYKKETTRDDLAVEPKG